MTIGNNEIKQEKRLFIKYLVLLKIIGKIVFHKGHAISIRRIITYNKGSLIRY